MFVNKIAFQISRQSIVSSIIQCSTVFAAAALKFCKCINSLYDNQKPPKQKYGQNKEKLSFQLQEPEMAHFTTAN